MVAGVAMEHRRDQRDGREFPQRAQLGPIQRQSEDDRTDPRRCQNRRYDDVIDMLARQQYRIMVPRPQVARDAQRPS